MKIVILILTSFTLLLGLGFTMQFQPVLSQSIGGINLGSIPGFDVIKGPKGDKGDLGPTGPQGPTGATGARGPAGPQGEKGDTGAIGPMGPEGDVGPQGPAGPIGLQGPQGETGATGAPGPKGDTGAEGPQGPAGMKGTDGDQGPKGDPGIQGPAGPIGPEGPKGDTGATGSMGPAGPQGPQGSPGTQGPFYQKLITLKPGERGWDYITGGLLDLTDLITLNNGSKLRDDILFNGNTWIDIKNGLAQISCDFRILNVNPPTLPILPMLVADCGDTLFTHPLTLLASSLNPLTP